MRARKILQQNKISNVFYKNANSQISKNKFEGKDNLELQREQKGRKEKRELTVNNKDNNRIAVFASSAEFRVKEKKGAEFDRMFKLERVCDLMRKRILHCKK